MSSSLARWCVVAALVCLAVPAGAQSARSSVTTVDDAEVTILSSNLANGNTIGEWGLSALVTVGDRCILFDAGRHPDTVLKNAEALDVDLSCVSDVVLSHYHFDHTTGLMPIVESARARNPQAIQRVHVAEGFFLSRRSGASGNDERNQMIAMRDELAAADIEIVVHDSPTEIVPGVWVSGPVARPHPERNYPETIEVRLDGEWIVDHVPESQALSIVTPRGHIVLMGCGHSGVVNALDHIRASITDLPIHALMGGLHLFAASDETLGWTADHLRRIGVEHLMAGHCTGIEPLVRLRTGLNLNRRTAVVGAVGSQFVYGEGIRPTRIAM